MGSMGERDSLVLTQTLCLVHALRLPKLYTMNIPEYCGSNAHSDSS